MNTRFLKHLAGGCALAFAASSALADPISAWDYEVALSWGTTGEQAPTFNRSNAGKQYISSTLISWGESKSQPDSWYATRPDLSGRSAVQITNTPATGIVLTDGAAVPTNTITHYNNVVSNSYGTLTTATIIADVKLWAPGHADGDDPLVSEQNIFQIYFVETPNTSGTCVPGSTSVCDDVFVLTMGTLNKNFEYGGFVYYVSMFEETNALDSLNNIACTRAGSGTPCIGFMTPESQATPARFAFTITSKPVVVQVPEPGMMALFGLGLLGIGAARRRKAA